MKVLEKMRSLFSALFVNELFSRSLTANYKNMLVIFDAMFMFDFQSFLLGALGLRLNVYGHIWATTFLVPFRL